MTARPSLFFLAMSALIGCGGGGASTANLMGSYSGTVAQSPSASVVVEFSVDSSGTISGQCTMVSGTSGAIMAQATVTGQANGATDSFTLSGTYAVFVPPPPDGSIGGVVTVTGKLPAKGKSSTITLTNGTLSFQGQISSIQIDPP